MIALSIAGSDPSGGAGIQADLKVFAARGAFGMAAITAITAQGPRGVERVFGLEARVLRAQLAPLEALPIRAVKLGMLWNAALCLAITDFLDALPQDVPVVLDPVLLPSHGIALCEPDLLTALRALLPRITLVTPNAPEAAALSGALGPPEAHAQDLLELGARAILLKGGHRPGFEGMDLLVTPEGLTPFQTPRIVGMPEVHGTGCALSAAIAAELAKGATVCDAIAAAKRHLAIELARSLEVGPGMRYLAHLP